MTMDTNARSLKWNELTIGFEQVVGQRSRRNPDRHVQGRLPPT